VTELAANACRSRDLFPPGRVGRVTFRAETSATGLPSTVQEYFTFSTEWSPDGALAKICFKDL